MRFQFVDSAPQRPDEREAAIERAREVMAKTDRVLIGAGAGLSTAAGMEYGGKRFERHFSAFIDRYGMTDMYSAGFYPFVDDEDRWAYWAHHATVNCLAVDALPLYKELFAWARTRDYFVITTNVDEQFEKAGFSSERIFAPQGNYSEIQCVTGEHGIRPAGDVFAAIERDTDGGRRTRIADPRIVPRCDVCGDAMTMHLRSDDSFVQTDEWYAAEARYRDFVAKIPERRTLLLELGVGWNTPVWIRMPFEAIAKTTKSTLIRMNYDSAWVDPAIGDSISIDGDMAETLPAIIDDDGAQFGAFDPRSCASVP